MAKSYKNNLKKTLWLALVVVMSSLALYGCAKTNNHQANQIIMDTSNEQIKKLWTKNIGIGDIGIKVFANNGFIYASNKFGTMFCMDEKSKEVVWKKEKYPDFTWLDISEGKIFFGSSDFNFYCLDEKTGNIIWVYGTDGGTCSKASFMAEYVYFGTSGNTLYCLETDTGKLAWKFEAKAGLVTKPIVKAEYVVFGSLDGNIYSCNSVNGKLHWRLKTEGSINNDPAIIDESIIFASGTKLCSLDYKYGGSFWINELGNHLLNSIVVYERFIYCQTENNLFCFAKDGDIAWKTSLMKNKDQQYSYLDMGSLIVDANGVIVINQSVIESYSLGIGKKFWERKRLFYESHNLTHYDKLVYLITNSSNIECITTYSGKTLWSFDLGTRIGYWLLDNGSVLVDSQTTVYPPGYSEGEDPYTNHTLSCFDQNGEKKLWSAGSFRNIEVIGGKIFCQTDDKNILSTNPETGLQDWLFKTKTDINFWDLKLEGNLLCFSTKGIEINDYQRTPSSNIVINCIDLTTGKLVWLEEMIQMLVPYRSPTPNSWNFSNGKVYYSDTSGITCINAFNGNILWIYDMQVQDALHFSSTEDKLFVSTPDVHDYSIDLDIHGFITCLDIATGKFLWKVDIGCGDDLIIGKSTLSFSGRNSYTCIDINKGTLLWKEKFDVKDELSIKSYVFDDSLILMLGNDKTMSFDLVTGNMNWSRKNTFGDNPLVNIYKDWAVIVGSINKISLVNLRTGMVDAYEEINTRFVNNIEFSDGKLIVSTGENLEAYAINFDNFGKTMPNVTLQVGNPILTVDGVGIDAGFEPVMFGDEVYVLPEMFELAFGFLVNIDQESAIISISDGKREVSISSTNLAPKSGSVVKESEPKTVTINGKGYIPLLKTCELFGASTNFDKITRAVEVVWSKQ